MKKPKSGDRLQTTLVATAIIISAIATLFAVLKHGVRNLDVHVREFDLHLHEPDSAPASQPVARGD
jgi:hypothetical protein